MIREIEDYFDRLFSVNRSLTGDGVRATLQILQEVIDLQICEVPSNVQALDWTIPREWNIREAYILTPEGRRVADIAVNNLHVVGYSVAVDGEFSFEELALHIITRPDLPEAIPYATSYYEERWGFCMAHADFLQLPRTGKYKVKIDATLAPGSMTYGEAVLKGETPYELLFTSYVCHPQMANNELSGPLVVAFLFRELKKLRHRKYTYRFLLGPETIGALYYLDQYGDHFRKYLEAGLVLTCCGDAGPFTYKMSRAESYIDRLVPHLLSSFPKHKVLPFFPMGSDERQYGSPGFNLPVGCLSRSMYGNYPEYHTSLDNKSILNFEALQQTIGLVTDIVRSIELEGKYVNQSPFGEPQLGRRGLYPTLMSDLSRSKSLERLLYLLNFADGKHRLLDIALRMKEPILEFAPELASLVERGLLSKEFRRLHEL